MEEQIKNLIGAKTLKSTGYSGGGCISNGSSYQTDKGQLIFVKTNSKEHARKMFDGEHAGLEAILETKTIRVPKSYGVIQLAGSSTSGIVLEHLNMKSLTNQALFGEQFAELHLHNENCLKLAKKQESHVTTLATTGSSSSDPDAESPAPISQFGFRVPTSCGYISMVNDWCSDWTTFYIRQRIQPQIDNLVTKNSLNRSKLPTLWDDCSKTIQSVLSSIQPAPVPALLHGDLWSGNIAATEQGEPLIFDPASYYGHSEFDFGIEQMFGGGLSPTFFNSYHKLIPKTKGFESRLQIYELFHHLNHWAHFGSGYESSSLRLMNQIIKNNST